MTAGAWDEAEKRRVSPGSPIMSSWVVSSLAGGDACCGTQDVESVAVPGIPAIGVSFMSVPLMSATL